MARKDHISLVGGFWFVIIGLLLQLLTTTGFAPAQNPVPLINQPLVPDTRIPGAAGFALTVNGTGFVSGATVNWNGSPLATTFVSGSRLTVSVPASAIAKGSTAWVTVVNPGLNGTTSNVAFLPVTFPTSIGLLGTEVTTLPGPETAATGDFNRDGKLDLAVADYGSNSVSILLGNGDGTFEAHKDYQVGSAPSSVVVGDFDGDGIPDLAVRNQSSNTVSILLGKGDGTFRPAMAFETGTGSARMVAADFNGDGKLDLATTNNSDGTVSILLGNGDGTFQAQELYDTGPSPLPIAVGDVNRDGKLDLVVGNTSTDTFTVLLGNGDGTFQPPISYPAISNPESVVLADFNGDSKLDLAVFSETSTSPGLAILLGNGDGTFRSFAHYASGCGSAGTDCTAAVADFNGDGKLDLAVRNGDTNTVSLILGNGDGTFQKPLSFPAGQGPEQVAVGDFNGDGRIDLVVPDLATNSVSVILQVPTVAISGTSLKFADQLVATSSAPQTVTLENTGYKTITIASVNLTGAQMADFSETNTCDSRLPANARCSITVTFVPTGIGPGTASIAIADSAAGSPQQIALTGTGVASGANAALSSTSLTFATQLLNTTSPAQTVTLSNYGTATLDITSISFTGANPGDFHQTNTCKSSVAPGASCTISISFKPMQRGSRTATLSVTDNAPASPQAVSLSGMGTEVELNPASLDFGVVQVGHSKDLATILTNVGSTAMGITGIKITGKDIGDFSQTNYCGLSVGPGKSCTITVNFHPAKSGPRDFADVSISDNGGDSPQQVSLSGQGCVDIIYNHRIKCTTLTTPAVQSALATSRTAVVPSSAGSSSIGTRILDWVDSGRDDPFLANGSKRELLVRFWYPASIDQGCKPAEYTSAGVWNYFSDLTKLPLPQVKTNSCLNAPVATGAHPVVVFTHGYTGTFTDYTFLFEDLASRGYVVASIDHTYEATAVEFPDGRFVNSMVGSHLANTWRTDDQTLSFALSVRLGDLTFVLNELERLNASPESPFVGKLDIARVALAGHSLGGLTTWFGLQQDARFRAGILLDPYVADIPLGQTDTPVVLLTMGSEQQSEDECQLWSDLHGPRFAVNLRGAEHLTPSDAVWLAKGAMKTGTMGPDKTIAAVRDYIAAFLDQNLLGAPASPLLTGPSAEFPDAVVTTQSQFLCGHTMKHLSNADHGESR